jgi:hypothetical protein
MVLALRRRRTRPASRVVPPPAESGPLDYDTILDRLPGRGAATAG